MRNSTHLKAYVRQHPDNKMGWYLLGKEYQKNGQEGKANYCFNQAGEVFEAFESKRMPADVWMEYEAKLMQMAKQKDQRAKRKRMALLALAVLLLAGLPSAYAPSDWDKLSEEAAASSSDSGGKVNRKDEGKPAAGAPAFLFTAMPSGGASTSASLAQLMLHQPHTDGQVAVIGLTPRKPWLLWSKEAHPAFTLHKDEAGKVNAQLLNAADCHCQPPENGRLTALTARWAAEQESIASLSSAMEVFRKKKGRLPGSLTELLQPFPNNIMYGIPPAGEDLFQRIMSYHAAASAAGSMEERDNDAPKQAAALFPTTLDGRPPLIQPMRIIVDKSNHRLALVSGSLIMRNYEVGLGGERTPEGKYVITDKVVNPNGKSNGEFGSRGMQLSDSNYAIHGTDEPDSIGQDSSKGCVRMAREDLEELFALVPSGTPVLIQAGGLPDEIVVPDKRFVSKPLSDQTNPRKTYHWLG
ncbi:L,D-transpeptidase [Paenibacillus sp. JX-17]|uniref:L,D-transpeptidase n=1 Tax=Paenibacillus lacisoli TaxID=3064525 RepID=A0ABT9CDE8_9BACL|nr:L,D-transpeptidase [Paenibacillus sp. JX-17]MDO7905997.1 L,D-transpeptidase [Paenibacillus sp. JX-17]